jgi:putative ABC transport system permease protein
MGSLVIQKWILGHGILMPPAPGLTRQFHVFIEIETGMIITAFTLGAIASFLATFFAAYQLSKAPIAVSLRSV